jgi:Fic family protein
MNNLTKLWGSSFLRVGHESEAIRKDIADRVYRDRVKNLDENEIKNLGATGSVWKEFAQLNDRPPKPGESSLELINEIEEFKKNDTHKFDLYENSLSWEAFKIALTNSSTAIEGYLLSTKETKLIIQTFSANISSQIGFTDEYYNTVKEKLVDIEIENVKATVNHATAMQYILSNIKGKLDTEMIQDINSLIIPENSESWSVSGLGETPYRKVPIHVTGSSIVRPYPQEIKPLMTDLIEIYHSIYHESREHPLINIINLKYNFLFIHPFSDGNGRTARLILNMELFKLGYVGCNILFEEKNEYISHFERCFYFLEYEEAYLFYLERIKKMQHQNAAGFIE